MVAEYYESNFDTIFHFKAAENLVAEHYVRDFVRIFHFKADQTWLQSASALW